MKLTHTFALLLIALSPLTALANDEDVSRNHLRALKSKRGGDGGSGGDGDCTRGYFKNEAKGYSCVGVLVCSGGNVEHCCTPKFLSCPDYDSCGPCPGSGTERLTYPSTVDNTGN